MTIPQVSRDRLTVDTERLQVWFDGQQIRKNLTAKEVEFLALLASRAGRLCLHTEIGPRFWADDYDPTAIHTFVSRLKAKLPSELAATITNVRGVGYRLDGINVLPPTPSEGVRLTPKLSPYLRAVAVLVGGVLGVTLLVTVVLPSNQRHGEQEESGVAEATAAGDLLLMEDFGSTTADAPATEIRPFTAVSYIDGELVVRKEGSDLRKLGTVGVHEPTEDSAIALDVRFAHESEGRYIMVGCRRDVVSAGPGMNSYIMHVDPSTKHVRISWVQNGRETPLSSIRPVSALHSPQEWNHLEFICSGPNLAAKVNGDVVLSVEHFALSSGYSWFGPGAQSAELDTEIHVDNLMLKALH